MLELLPTFVQRSRPKITPVRIHAVEGHQERRCCQLVAGIAEQVKLRHEILVEDADFAIKDQRLRRQLRDPCG